MHLTLCATHRPRNGRSSSRRNQTVMTWFARACAIMVSAFPRRCRTVFSILSLVRKLKGSEWDLQNVLIRRRREEQLVFITGHGDISMCAQAMKAGAVDFLPKPFRDTELLQCVQRALARSADQRQRAIEKAAARRVLDLLTPREFEVMQLVITGMLNKQIASELGTAEKTIKVHRGRVMKKLGIASVADLVRLVETAQIPFPRWCETKV